MMKLINKQKHMIVHHKIFFVTRASQAVFVGLETGVREKSGHFGLASIP